MGCSLEFGYMYYWWASKASETVLIKNKKIRYYMCLFVWDAQIQLFRLIAHSFFWYYSSKQIMIFLRSAFISIANSLCHALKTLYQTQLKTAGF